MRRGRRIFPAAALLCFLFGGSYAAPFPLACETIGGMRAGDSAFREARGRILTVFNLDRDKKRLDMRIEEKGEVYETFFKVASETEDAKENIIKLRFDDGGGFMWEGGKLWATLAFGAAKNDDMRGLIYKCLPADFK